MQLQNVSVDELLISAIKICFPSRCLILLSALFDGFYSLICETIFL